MKKFLKSFVFGILAVLLASIGIDAADHYDNMSQSVLGRIFFGKSSPCPDDMVFVSNDSGGFCIDKFENSASKTCNNQSISSQLDTAENLNQADCYPVSKKGKEPWKYISQSQAKLACAKAGKRLPTNKEWYEASLGVPDPISDWSKDDCQVAKNWSAHPGLTGSGKNCVSSFGAYDMIGNVWEWVDGEIENGKFMGKNLPKSGYVVEVDKNGIAINTANGADVNFNKDYFWLKSKGIRGMARGGYWDNAEKAGIYSMYLVSPTSYAGVGIGFRCVKDANIN